jgi:hypothetical protein
MFLRNVGRLSKDYAALYPRRQISVNNSTWKTKALHSFRNKQSQSEFPHTFRNERYPIFGCSVYRSDLKGRVR